MSAAATDEQVEAAGVFLGIAREPSSLPPRLKRVLLAAVAISAGAGLLGSALSPYLLVEYPLLLVGLNPDSRHLVLAAAERELWQVVAVGVPRRIINFWITYGLARVYGDVAVRWLEKRHPLFRRIVGWIEALYLKLGGWLVALVPLYTVAGLAGMARMPFRKFAVVTIPGQIAFVALITYLGESLKAWTTPVVAFLRDHLLESTLIAIAIVATQQLYKAWQRRGQNSDEQPTP